MSGGVAYVYDEDGQFARRCNTSMVALEKVSPREEQEAASLPAGWHNAQSDEAMLKKLIEDHHRWTGSLRAREILDNWAGLRSRFVKVLPHEYKRVLGERAAKAAAAHAIATATGKPVAAAQAVPAK